VFISLHLTDPVQRPDPTHPTNPIQSSPIQSSPKRAKALDWLALVSFGLVSFGERALDKLW